jgi:hypothetical protein
MNRMFLGALAALVLIAVAGPAAAQAHDRPGGCVSDCSGRDDNASHDDDQGEDRGDDHGHGNGKGHNKDHGRDHGKDHGDDNGSPTDPGTPPSPPTTDRPPTVNVNVNVNVTPTITTPTDPTTPATVGAASTATARVPVQCLSNRVLVLRVRRMHGLREHGARVTVTVGGVKVPAGRVKVRRNGTRVVARIDLRGQPSKPVKVHFRAEYLTQRGKMLVRSYSRSFRLCVPRGQ